MSITYNYRTGTITATTFSGNASTASQWQTTRTITMSGDVSSDAVNIDGSGNITITNTAVANDSHTHGAANLTGTTLAAGVVTSSLTTVGTIGTGVWQGTAIDQTYLVGQSGTNTGDQTSIVGITGTTAQFNTALTDGSFATGGGTATGTNTGDQTSIVGITGTTAQFNTALTDGSFATGGGTATGTNTGDQTITLTGDVTGTGTGSFAATIAADSVTMDKIQDIATDTFLGRVTAATGTVEVLTNAQAKTALDLTGTNSGDEPAASLTVAGIVELATVTETNTGTDATRAVTPDGLDGWTGSAQLTTAGALTATSFTDSTLSATGVLYAGTGGIIENNASNFVWDNTNSRLVVGGVLNLVEQADHSTSPVGGRGEVWVKSGTLGGELMYTDGDQDNDFTAYNVIETVYHFDQTTTAADPGAGNMRWNNVTPASVTNWYLDDLDETGRDASFLLANLADGDILTLRSMWSDADYMVASVNGTPTDNTGYWTVPVTVIHSNSLPATGDPCHITVEWASQAGSSGTVTSVAAGNGLDFTTITTTGSVTLGTPGSLSSASTNAVTATSHTHAITSIDAADIAAGSLATGVNSYFTASTAASNFKVPFMNYTGTASTNAGLLHDDQSTFTYNPSTNTLSAGVFSGSGASLTSLTAANISAGNLGSGVLPYATASTTNSAFKIPLMNTTGDTSGNYGLLNGGNGPRYNPSTETLSTVNLSADDATLPILGTSDTFSMTGTMTVSGSGIVDLNDNRPLRFGTGDDVSILWDGVDLEITAAAASPAINFRDGAVLTLWDTTDAESLAISTSLTEATFNAQSGNTIAFQQGGSDILTLASGTSTFTSGVTLSGASDDLNMPTDGNIIWALGEIYATANDFVIRSKGSSTGNDFFLQTNAGGTAKDAIIMRNNFEVELYYNDALTFETALYTASDGGTGANVVDGTNTLRPVGFNVMPVYEIDANDSFDLAHSGMLWHKDLNAAVTFTCDNDATIPQGACWVVHNDDTEALTIAQGTGVTVYWTDGSGAPTAGNVTVDQGGLVTVYKYTDTEFWVWGAKTAAAGGGLSGTIADNQVVVGTGASTVDSSASLTFNGSTLGVSADIECTLQIQAVNGLIGTYDDAASASWGGPIWGMDDGFTGPTGGANALATSCYGMRWNRASSTQANSSIGEGLYVYQNGVLEGGIGTAGVYSAAIMRAAGNIYPGGQTLGYLEAVTGNYGSVQCNGADGSSGSYSGFSVEGELVLMLSGTTGGIYDDVNNQWKLRADTTSNALAGKTSSVQAYDHANAARDVGFNDLKLVSDNPASVAVLEQHMGGVIYADDNSGFTVSLPTSTASFPVGGVITIINANTSGNITVSDPGASYTLFYLDGTTRTDVVTSCTVGPGGVATVWRQASTGSTTPCYLIWGSGITP